MTIKRNSNNNVIIQIVNVEKNQNHELEEKPIEEYTATSFRDTKEKFLELFLANKNLGSSDSVISLIMFFQNQISEIQNAERRKRLFTILATIATCYVIFHTTVKGGIVLFTILGITITVINIRGCASTEPISQQVEFAQDHRVTKIDSGQQQVLVDTIENKGFDSIGNTKRYQDSTKLNSQNSHPKNSVINIEDLFVPNPKCSNLAEIATLQREAMLEDYVDHVNQGYFIDKPDDKYYLHVAAYRTIKEAAFQRNYLIKQGYYKSKIIRLGSQPEALFGVTIDDFYNYQVLNLCQEKSSWDNVCNIENSKAKMFHNAK